MRHVRTQDGVKRFGLPLGAPITAEALARARSGGKGRKNKGGSSAESTDANTIARTGSLLDQAHQRQAARSVPTHMMDGTPYGKPPGRRVAAVSTPNADRPQPTGRRSAAGAPSNEDKIRNAETMHGTGSKQHLEAQRRFGGTSIAQESTLDGTHKIEVGGREFRMSPDATVRTPKAAQKPIAYVNDPADNNDLHVLTEHGEVPVAPATKDAVKAKIDANPDRFTSVKPSPAEDGDGKAKASGRRALPREEFKNKPTGPRKIGEEMDGTPITTGPDGTGKRKASVTESPTETDDISLPGGTVPAGADAAASAAADDVIAKVSQIEPDVTKQMQDLAKKYGGVMEGLDFRLKAKDSMVRKIKADAIEKNVTPDVAASQLGDALRYTMLNDPERHSEMVKAVLSDFEGQGYRLKVKNFWQDRLNTYRGINVQLQHPDTGTVIELQFNTPDSYKVKMEANHVLYEQQRVLPKSDPKWAELNHQMVKNSMSIPRPKWIDTVQPKNDIRFDDNFAGSATQRAASKQARTGRDVNADQDPLTTPKPQK
jgi:hypothetical protein